MAYKAMKSVAASCGQQTGKTETLDRPSFYCNTSKFVIYEAYH